MLYVRTSERFSDGRTWLLVAIVALALAAQPGTGRAQGSEPSVGVLRATSGAATPELSDAVDAALLRDLSAIAGIASPVVSPVDYAEIQLSLGCSDDSRACLEQMARTARVEALVVRSLSVDDAGRGRLELRYFDSASSDEPKAVSIELPAEASAELVAAVPKLVRELFGIPEVAEPAPSVVEAPTTAASPAHVEPTPRESSAPIAPWILIGTGAAALTTGIIIGAVANEDFRAWKERPVESRAQADEANDDFDGIETRAIAASILIPVGALALGLGATWLLLELGGDDEEAGGSHAQLGVAPSLHGALLQLRGAM